MTHLRLWSIALTITILLVAVAGAQETVLPACEDQLLISQIQLQATTVSELRERRESAQEIAALRKRVNQLEIEVAKLRQKETPKPPAPKEKTP